VSTTAALLQDLFGDRNISLQIDHRGLQNLVPVSSFGGDFLRKECTAITQEARKTASRPLPTLTVRSLKNFKKQLKEDECFFSRR
jgi:hypothetical protein